MIAWDPSLSVGVEEIDEQHRAIITLINALGSGKGADDPAMVVATLRFLRDYLNGHFDLEMELMLDLGYPQLETHRQQHELFINHVIFFEIEREFGVVTRAVLDDLLAFLKDWFFNHIATEDKALGEFVRRRALSA